MALEPVRGFRRLVMDLERGSEVCNMMRKRTVDARKIDV